MTTKNTTHPLENTDFSHFNLSQPILKAILEQGYQQPSPIQSKAIPIILQRNDVLAAAQTGTGKTAGFTLPILQHLSTTPPVERKQAKVLILTPTRELAAQILASITTYGKHLKLRSTVVFGGVNINPQKSKLAQGIDILVATPGRLLDLYNQKAISFNQLTTLVLDEADRMLDMGFIHDIRKILAVIPKQRQTLLFSATFSPDIRKLAKQITQNPIEISVTPSNTTATTVTQHIYSVQKAQKAALLTHLLKQEAWTQVLIFTKTKHGANKLTRHLEKNNLKAVAIHGNKSQAARTKALADFKANKVSFLVATDIAARGLDIAQLPHVINYELPYVPQDYVHRIGRTGRAGASGHALSLVCSTETSLLNKIQRLIKQTIPVKTCPEFKETTAATSQNRPKKGFVSDKHKHSTTANFNQKKRTKNHTKKGISSYKKR